MDLNDLCQTFVGSRPKEHSLANRRHYLACAQCSIVCGLFSVQCITVN